MQATIFAGAFLVLFIPLYVSDSMFFPYITGKNFAFRIIVEIIFAAWVVLALLDAQYRPRFSWILISGASLLGVMFFADFFGEYTKKSFTSNFERMEGYVTLLHFYLYFLVLSHALRGEKAWNWFWNTALVAGVIVSIYGLRQAAGLDPVGQGSSWRLDARLGNSTYLGVYMLFQIFITSWMFIRVKNTGQRFIYGVLFILFTFILFHTGTRGTILGLFGGGILTFSYLAVMAPKGALIKKWAVVGAVAVILVASGLWASRDRDFVKSTPMLDRVAGVSLAEGSIRFTVWQMAIEGFKERPLLGWGQDNFNYVFNKFYKPSLYGAESWYDRTHNILLDWLIAGGVLGLFSYLSILFMALWYSCIRSVWIRFRDGTTDQNYFNVHEQALLLGLLAAYTFHNLFVFDNLISYIFYAAVLALIHSRVTNFIPVITESILEKRLIVNVFTPTIGVFLVMVFYFLHLPGISAAKDMIDALSTANVNQRYAALDRALDRDSFARQEVVEQLLQQAISVVTLPNIPPEVKEKFLQKAVMEMEHLIKDKPGDARLHFFLSNLYRAAGQIELAKQELERAIELSPNKQALIIDLGTLEAIEGDYEAMRDLYQKAFMLDQNYNQARFFYAGALMYVGEHEKVNEIITEEHWQEFAMSDQALAIAYQSDSTDWVIKILEERIDAEPNDAQHRASMASVYYEDGQINEAIAILEQAIEDIPEFSILGQCYVSSMRSGEDPRASCQP